jgi:hypothetical protein
MIEKRPRNKPIIEETKKAKIINISDIPTDAY